MNKFYKYISIVFAICLFIVGLIMNAQSDELVKLRKDNEDLRYRISVQVELIDLQNAVGTLNEALLIKVEKLNREKEEMLANLEALAALQPLYDILPLDDLLGLISEIPPANLFNSDWQITANFGESVGYHGRLRSIHEGIDIIPTGGDGKIRAFAGGEVIQIDNNEKFGKHLTIQHSERVRTFYAHAAMIYYSADLGEIVSGGDIIAVMGNTGQVYSSVGNDGVHVHFELQVKVGETWLPINPRPFMSKEEK